ncbi:MAG: protease-like activity factor CPAF [Myxococcota bacterium]|nr:protease-like activity factor CPAF [Myxococcota bacterium]
MRTFLMVMATALLLSSGCAREVKKTPVAAGPTPAQRQMLFGLDTVHGAFDAAYAPKDWKKIHSGWDLDQEIARAKKRVMANPSITLPEYRKILNDFFDSPKDYHVGVRFLSTESAELPFGVIGVQGRYFVSWMKKSKLPQDVDFQVGDEVVRFGGEPIAQVIARLKRDRGGNTSETDQRLAERDLTRREARRGMVVPQGPVSVGYIDADGQRHSEWIPWKYEEETITLPGMSRGGGEPTLEPEPIETMDFDPVLMAGAVTMDPVARRRASDGRDPQAMGSREGFLPLIGERLQWRAAQNLLFHAYVSTNDQGVRIGFIRIPTYSPKGLMEYAQAASVIIAEFERRADVMVIDQTNNGGGMVMYMLGLLSMLTDRPMALPKERVTLTASDVSRNREWAQWLERIRTPSQLRHVRGAQRFDIGVFLHGYAIDMRWTRTMHEVATFKISEWQAGRTYTQPTYLAGIDHIAPHPAAHFTKPIIVLTNAEDFSCADFFPAILQDSGRALIMGSRTAGAGGYVHTVSYPPNMLGIESFRMTGSLAERINHQPIENLGVQPDVPYALTVEDIKGGYKAYARAINDVINSRFASSIPR